MKRVRVGGLLGTGLVVALSLAGCAGDEGGGMAPRSVVVAGSGAGVPASLVDPVTGLPVAGTGAAGTGVGVAGAGSGAIDPVTGEPVPSNDGSSGAGGTTTTPTTTGTPIPCDVATVVQNNCHACHGPNPVGGALRLTSYEDWHRQSPIYGPSTLGDPTKQVFEVAQIRINNGEMPQGRSMASADLTMLDSWLKAGALAGGEADASCAATTPVDPPTNNDNPALAGSECTGADAYDPLVPRAGETCYDFRVHGVSSPTDTSKFSVQPGESYHEFIYDVPWPAGTLATRFGADFDNIQVLHHWLAFDYTTTQPAGQVNINVTGTTLGASAQLIGGWAVGGCNFVLPDEMGLRLPNSGHIMVQWHMYNTTGTPQPDGTAVQFCTVPAGGRPNVGGLTWLGTENLGGLLGMGPGMNEYFGTCINDSAGPITIVGFLPHLHTIGINMRSEVQRAGSATWETVFDQPFDFNWQVHYMLDPKIVLQPNDKIKSTCTFFNDTGVNVPFGQSTNQEMCYQFAFSYPAGALDNGVLSLIGATNTCWQFGE